MADFVFNIAKGKVAYYGMLPVPNDALVMIPLETTGLEADAALKDYDTVLDLLAGTTNEQTTMGRKIISAATATPDDVLERMDVDIADQTWLAASGNPISKLLIAYDPDSTSGDDSTLIPLTCHDFVVTPSGGDIVAQIATTGFFRAT